jgi:hypothetical protein
MIAKFQMTTPDSCFPVFSSEIRPDLFVATVVYCVKPSKDAKEKNSPAFKADLHMAEGTTEAEAFQRLKDWCVRTFGEPCNISKAK